MNLLVLVGTAIVGLMTGCNKRNTAPVSGNAGLNPGNSVVSMDAGVSQPPDVSVSVRPDVSLTTDVGTGLMYSNAVIIPSALEGCRAPDEPGCARCCEPSNDPAIQCIETRSEQGIYNGSAVLGAPCPASCRRCAKCSKSSERGLRELVNRPECDCRQPAGPDPCFHSGSCGCYCAGRLSLEQACPIVGRPPVEEPSIPPAPETQANSNTVPPRIRGGMPTRTGALSPEAIRRIVMTNMGQVQHCHEEGLHQTPEMEGDITIHFVIAVDGTVANSEVLSTTGTVAPSVATCIATATRRWQFPQPDPSGIVDVRYPFHVTRATNER